jgi:hypothetical protein
MKAYSLADSVTGYTFNWMLAGKDDSLDTSDNRTVTHAIVLRLLEAFIQR